MPADKFQVRLLKIAEEDFTEIINFIADDNPIAAEATASKIEKNLELLSDNPSLGRRPRDEEIKNLGYRYLIVQNYIVFIRLKEEQFLFIEFWTAHEITNHFFDKPFK